MYLPKICGNILRCHPSALAGALLLCSCSPEPRPGPEVQVFAYQLDECELPPGNARIELEALGDFDPSNRTSDSLATDARGSPLSFPPRTIGVQASLTSERSSERFLALASAPRDRALSLLLWPDSRACALSARAPRYPVPGGGQGIGYSERLGLVLLAGSDNSTSSAVSGAMTFDIATGETMVLPPGPGQMSRARAFPTVTPFGEGFLVAGGEDPTVTFDSGRRNLRATAELYDPESARFEDEVIELIDRRSRHTALVLPSGDTALIGGLTESPSGERTALAKTELIHLDSKSTGEGPQLSEARIAPSALWLSDGRVFVGGGETLSGELVRSVEWLDAELVSDRTVVFEARYDQAFVAMPGGAVLAVGGCEEREGSGEECGMCRRGCRPEGGWDAFWISATGKLSEFGVAYPVARPQLIHAGDGAPFLVTEDEDGAPLLLRFDPWSHRFESVDGGGLPLPTPGLPTLALDAGAYLWVSDDGDVARLWGRRFSTRNPFSHDSELIRVTHPTDTAWPLHLAPGEAFDSLGGLVPPEDEVGPWLLELAEGNSWITDTSYADFELELELAAGSTPELLVNQQACRWPVRSLSGTRELTAVRRGTRITLAADGEESDCEVDRGRANLGFGAPPATRRNESPEPARLKRISVHRGDP